MVVSVVAVAAVVRVTTPVVGAVAVICSAVVALDEREGVNLLQHARGEVVADLFPAAQRSAARRGRARQRAGVTMYYLRMQYSVV